MSTPRRRLVLARAAALFAVAVLVLVPALTRAGQKLDTASRAPSFRNVECPPKKVTVAPVETVVPASAIDVFEAAPVVRIAPASDLTPPRSPFLSTPRPLRAPPSALLS